MPMHSLGCARSILLTAVALLGLLSASAVAQKRLVKDEILAFERERIVTEADGLLSEQPQTITAFPADRSAGGLHDFFSEGDYWWPDPKNPDGPYIQRDGMTNPDNFVKHRQAMLRFSRAVSTLAAAWLVTGDARYAAHAMKHLTAWCVTDSTKMNPHLRYAQAIRNKVTGRGTGIIDTIHLIDVARALDVLAGCPGVSPEELAAVRAWFAEYVKWLTTHPYGIEERDAKNNHGTWWVAQVAAFARAVGDTAVMNDCRQRYVSILLPNQMAADGSFPLELKRTKPYNYSLFNTEGMAVICQSLSTRERDLWSYALPDGRSMKKAMEFIVPFIADKSGWPYPKDVMYYDYYPARQPSLLFAGIAYHNPDYIALWKQLTPELKQPEVIRSIAVKQPVLWIP